MNRNVNAAQRLADRIGILPTNPVAGTVNGTGVDIHQLAGGGSDFGSARLCGMIGATTGTPTSGQVIFTIQDSADNSVFANLLDSAGVAQSLTLTTVGSVTRGSIAVNLQSARRYVRVVAVTSFMAGTAPTLYQSCQLVLAGAVNDPQASPVP